MLTSYSHQDSGKFQNFSVVNGQRPEDGRCSLALTAAGFPEPERCFWGLQQGLPSPLIFLAIYWACPKVMPGPAWSYREGGADPL